MLFRSLVYGLLTTLLSGCLQTTIEQPTYDSNQLNDAIPWQARGKMLVSTNSERQMLRFIWTHLSEAQDRVELSDTLGLQSVTLVKEFNRYYRENDKGQRVLLSANKLREPFAGVLSSIPTDISRLLTGGTSSSRLVTSEVVSWSTSAQFTTPEVLLVNFDGYFLKIIINQWEIDISE